MVMVVGGSLTNASPGVTFPGLEACLRPKITLPSRAGMVGICFSFLFFSMEQGGKVICRHQEYTVLTYIGQPARFTIELLFSKIKLID